jgi:hypothetical protein
MRHSFASYHLAKHREAPRTAVLLGHPNPTLLYRTYWELVLPQEADKFWEIVPDSVRVQRQEARLKDEEARKKPSHFRI